MITKGKKRHTFQLLGGGTFHDLDNRVYKVGELIHTDVDLVKQFGKEKFAKVGLPSPDLGLVDPDMDGLKDERRRARLAAQSAEDDGAAVKADLPARGEDSSAKFPEAAAAGFEVFKREKLYHVYEPGSAEAINPEGLKGSAVEAFVKKHLES